VGVGARLGNFAGFGRACFLRYPAGMKKLPLSLVVGAALAAASCSDNGQGRPNLPETVDVHLVPLAGCGDVEAALRQGALEAMNRQLDQAERYVLTDDFGSCRPERAYDYGPEKGDANSDGDDDDDASDGGGERPGESTGTNNQTADVDEADFVKNDGKYIYLLSNGSFRILEAWPAESTREIANVPIAGGLKKLFVEGDRALVYSSPEVTGGGDQDPYGRGGYRSGECTYGYDCDYRGDGRPTDLTVYDVSDRTAPKVVRSVRTNASLIAARRIGETVYTVLSSPGATVPNLSYYPEVSGGCKSVLDAARYRAAFDDLRRKNAAIIATAPLGVTVPTISDGGAPDALAACPSFYRASPSSETDAFTTVLSFSIADAASPLRTSTVVSQPGATYASGEALYLAVPPDPSYDYYYYGDDDSGPKPDERSVVHKFALAGGAAEYAASGQVKGRVLNQFSMDEREGFLRIATTSGHLPDPKTHSTLTVLGQRGVDLDAVGAVDDVAPSEDIRSVRFEGDRGYVVTFKKTDPLFVFDLADPYAPRTVGELKIPGFSTYMHRLDEGHLLTIGYDADDMGDFAFFDGVLLQIFDVRDPANPKLAHKEVIGTRGSSSEALTNHLAFTYFAQRGLLALPMSICEGGGDGQYGQFTFGGVLVYGVSAEGGFTPRGRVDFGRPSEEELSEFGPDACSNWWTHASSAVKRTIFMDDFLYSVSDAMIKVNNVGDLATDVATVGLTNAPAAE
jgi:beta propeller domain-containing protein